MAELCYNTMNWSPYLVAEGAPSLPAQITAASAAGFRWFGADEGSIGRYCDLGGSVEELAALILAANMRTYELPTLMLGAQREQNRASTERLAALADQLQPEFVQLNMDSLVDTSVIEDLQYAGEVFGKLGVRLAIEYLPWLPEVRNINATRDVLKRAGVAGAGVLVDCWHFTHSDDTCADLEALPLDEVAYVQFNDHPALIGDDLLMETITRRAMPGAGEFELDRFASIFRKKGYGGVVSCEVISLEAQTMDVDSYARAVYQSSKTYWPD
ncbi:sugar phosphate isomerase/epimerase family protein [Candidatus Litorirhabdus singularis]|nr:TIM barrel protein [Candidatus Litorirhabdus singularis]